MKWNVKRKVAGLLGVLMAFSLTMSDGAATLVKADGGGGTEVAFTDGTVSGNDITYGVGNQSVTVSVSGGDVADSKITVPQGSEGSVTFTLSGNYDPDTMEVRVYTDEGFNDTLTVTNNVTSLANKTNEGGLPTSLKLKVASKNTQPGGPDPQPGGNPGTDANGASRPAELYTGEAKQSTWTLNGEGDIYINGIALPTMGETNPGGNANYNLSEDGKVYFEFSSLHIMRYTSIIINGIDYSSYIPHTQQELLDALDANGNDQTMNFVLPGIDYAANYTIEATWKIIDEEDAEYEPIGNFLWSYLDADAGSDDYLDHGKMTFVSLEYDGVTYNSLEELEAADKCYLRFGELNNGEIGSAVLPYGAELTVKLLPEYGYQLSSFTINGGQFEAGSEIGVYSFTIPRGNFHLGAHFTQVSDAVQASGSKEIAAGNIQLGANEIDMGSAVLTVGDATATATEKSAFANAASGYTVDSYLNLNLNQVVYKGNTTDYWTTDMSTLNSDAAISLKLSDTLTSNDVEIIHQKHDGTYEVIPATYDAVTNTVTFRTDSFSKYAIAYKTTNGGGGSNNGNNNSNNSTTNNSAANTNSATSNVTKTSASPKTGEETPIGWLFVLLMVSGAGVVLAGKKRKESRR